MVFGKSFLLATLFCFSLSVLGQEIIAQLNYNKDLGAIRGNASFVIDESGQYTFKTNINGLSFCERGRPGMYKGKLTSTELLEIKKDLTFLNKECQKTSLRCLSKKEKGHSWSLFLPSLSKTVHFHDKELPNLISKIEKVLLKQNGASPIYSMNFEKRDQGTYELFYQGDKLSYEFDPKNIFLLLKNGSLVNGKKYLDLKKSDHKKVFSFFDKRRVKIKIVFKKEFKNSIRSLFIDNSIGVHHLDPQKRTFINCISL